ncbi:MAG: DHH family phosphoesterase, partial [Rikenellaceae bacterium]|nr:DHH family phosphoesterase [Rikenellaceae bacterium]
MIDKKEVEALKELLAEPKRITVVSHVNPDGDAIGSGLAWTAMLEEQGHTVRFIVPNAYPAFLEWMAEINKVYVYKIDPEALDEYIAESELIFCLDFNQIDRLDALGLRIAENGKAKRILIDHHLQPPQNFNLMFSDTSSSSTSLLVYELLEALGWEKQVNYPVAEALYVGICTDTGNFSFGYLTPELFRVVARLVEKGVDPPKLNVAIYNNFSAERMRLMGYMLHQKMEIIPTYRAACMTLDKEEQKRFRFKPGDSEGFVNLPLSIKTVSLSAFFLETKECIKVSLRSRGEIDVNDMARKYFNGGGHKNAAGGKHFGPMREAVQV